MLFRRRYVSGYQHKCINNDIHLYIHIYDYLSRFTYFPHKAKNDLPIYYETRMYFRYPLRVIIKLNHVGVLINIGLPIPIINNNIINNSNYYK